MNINKKIKLIELIPIIIVLIALTILILGFLFDNIINAISTVIIYSILTYISYQKWQTKEKIRTKEIHHFYEKNYQAVIEVIDAIIKNAKVSDETFTKIHVCLNDARLHLPKDILEYVEKLTTKVCELSVFLIQEKDNVDGASSKVRDCLVFFGKQRPDEIYRKYMIFD